MEIKLKSALRIPRQQLLLVVRALIFVAALWLFADTHFGIFQLVAFGLIGGILYFTPVFHALAVFPSFLVLMILAPVAMSVFGPQLTSPILLAGFFGVLFYLILGLKQVLFIHQLKIHYVLHLALMYCLSILFFAAPAGEWFLSRSIALFSLSYLLLKETLTRRFEKSTRTRFLAALGALLITEAVWAIGLLPLGFINAAGALLVFVFALEETLQLIAGRRAGGRNLVYELIIGALLLITIFIFSSWNPA